MKSLLFEIIIIWLLLSGCGLLRHGGGLGSPSVSCFEMYLFSEQSLADERRWVLWTVSAAAVAMLQWIHGVRALRMRRSQLYPVSRAALAPAGQLLGWSAQCCLVLTDRQTTHVERLHLTRCSRTHISQTTPGVLVRLPAQPFSSNRYVTTVSHCFFDY